MNNKSSFLAVVLIFLLFINLFAQDYSKLDVNKTITVNYEPYSWEMAAPEELNVNLEKLDDFLENIKEWENLQSILVIKDEKILLEKYYKGTNRYSAFNTYSITKSFTSALIGIAIKNNLIKSENEPVLSFLPEYWENMNDERKERLTIKHLLTMTGGIEPEKWWNPNIDYALLQAPMKSNPGEKFYYYNALPHMLSVVITKSSELTIKEFAENHLFDPLGINCAYWKKDGKYFSGRSNTYFTPRDLARLGSLYLKKGNIDGNQIIDTTWIDNSFMNYADSDQNFFLTGHKVNQTGYGYLWWILEAGNTTYYAAYGAGDQFLIINPLDNTIVVVSQLYKDTWFEKKEDIDKLYELLKIFSRDNRE